MAYFISSAPLLVIGILFILRQVYSMMSQPQKEITMLDVLFDESLLNAYAEQEYEKYISKHQKEYEENKNKDWDDQAFSLPASAKYFAYEYLCWKKTVCKLCDTNPQKDRYYKKLASIEKMEQQGMASVRPQLGFREKYPRAFCDDDPSAPDYGHRITMADVLADETLLDLWAMQQWEDDSIEAAKQRFGDFRSFLIADKVMPPTQILQKFRKDKIKATGIDAGTFDIKTEKMKYADLFSEDDPDNQEYPKMLTIADVYVNPGLLEHYCKQGFVNKAGGISIDKAMQQTRQRIENLRGSGRLPGKHALLRYKTYRERLRKKHNIHFSENGALQG